ncbi:leucine-rich repeat receptor protein kinase MSP1-like [Magnolia sinica]|uniref:leucine-rich repeat receptor protein kinase MSP1-like n=1 Tax=Magnolia sinica TaxID=86752 RepID=UPI0026580BBD|nr:leucine-rich repeat receptor protein kinase MSP1-like [Magnolia sinica]
MGGVNFTGQSDNWLQVINMLPSLSALRLPHCELGTIPVLPYVNFTSLSVLDLSSNDLGPRMPDWVFNLSSLEYLNLNSNNFQDPIPNPLHHLCNLHTLDLSDNIISVWMTGSMECSPGCIKDSLESLNLASNQVSGYFPDFLCQYRNLKSLDLTGNSFYGPIPGSLGNFSTLRELYLSHNNLSGALPESLGQLSELVDLRISSNSFEGNVSEAHFANLMKLESIDMSSNSLVVDVSSSWVPPFQLKHIKMWSCKLGHQFPAWLQTQRNVLKLDFSDAQISDSMPYFIPPALCKLQTLLVLDLSYNQLTGELPWCLGDLQNLNIMDLGNNNLSGAIIASISGGDKALISEGDKALISGNDKASISGGDKVDDKASISEGDKALISEGDEIGDKASISGGSAPLLVTNFIQLLSSEFAMKDLGPIHHFLGIKISPTSNGLHLSQSHYALTILERANMVDCKPMSTPLEAKTKTSSTEILMEDPSYYRELVGALQYLTLTRPDLSLSVNYHSLREDISTRHNSATIALISGGDKALISGGDKALISESDKASISGGDKVDDKASISGGDKALISGGEKNGDKASISGGDKALISGGDEVIDKASISEGDMTSINGETLKDIGNSRFYGDLYSCFHV